MKLCTYQSPKGPRVGVVADGSVFDGDFDGTMIDLIRDWPSARAGLEKAVAQGRGLPLEDVQLLAPVLRPGKIFAIGLNYADHIAESKLGTPEAPGLVHQGRDFRQWPLFAGADPKGLTVCRLRG